MSRALLTAALAALVFTTGAGAQNLEPTTRRLANAWQSSDAGAISNLAAKSGVSVDVDGQKVGPLQARQAAMTLKRVFEQRETVSARVGRVREVEGDPRRAFVEITWVTRARGTTIPEESVVFFSLVAEGRDWHITEIRLIQ